MTHSTATKSATGPIGPRTAAFLARLRYTAAQIGRFDAATRVVHDLLWIGDDWIENFEVMREVFGGDLQRLQESRYTPAELSWDALVLSKSRAFRFFGLQRLSARAEEKYVPVTLAHIENVLESCEWVDPVD